MVKVFLDEVTITGIGTDVDELTRGDALDHETTFAVHSRGALLVLAVRRVLPLDVDTATGHDMYVDAHFCGLQLIGVARSHPLRAHSDDLTITGLDFSGSKKISADYKLTGRRKRVRPSVAPLCTVTLLSLSCCDLQTECDSRHR